MMNQILGDLSNHIIIVYLNYILIYPKKINEHQYIVIEVLRNLDE
jgi:hypothetical protein